MKKFAKLINFEPQQIIGDHNGEGPILFRRLFTKDEFASPIDFIDFTIIHPNSSIGIHPHEFNEEAYLIVKGEASVTVNGEEQILVPGDVAVVRSGESHGLMNNSEKDVWMFVVQVRS